MALEIKNQTPLPVRHPTSFTIIPTITGWGNAVGTLKDGADTSTSWSWFEVGDNISLSTIKQYIADNVNAVRLWIYFEYGQYVRYSGANTSTSCPDTIPRTLVDYMFIEQINQSKSDEEEIEEKECVVNGD